MHFPSNFPRAKYRVWKLRNTVNHTVLKSVHPKQNEEQHTISSSKKKRRTPHRDFLTCIINHYQSRKHMQTQYIHPILFHTNQNFPLAEMKKPANQRTAKKKKHQLVPQLKRQWNLCICKEKKSTWKKNPQKLKFIVNFLFTVHPSPTRFSS